MKRAAIILLAVLAVVLSGCAGWLDSATIATNESARFVRDAHDAIEERQTTDLRRAIDASSDRPAAVVATAKLIADYDPIWRAYEVLRGAVLSARAAIQSAQLAKAVGKPIDQTKVLQAVGAVEQAVGAFVSAGGAR